MALDAISETAEADISKSLGNLFETQNLDKYKIDEKAQNRAFWNRAYASGTAALAAIGSAVSWQYEKKTLAGLSSIVGVASLAKALSPSDAAQRKQIQSDFGNLPDQLRKTSLAMATLIANKINAEQYLNELHANRKAALLLQTYTYNIGADVTPANLEERASIHLFQKIFPIAVRVSNFSLPEGNYHADFIEIFNKIQTESIRLVRGSSPAVPGKCYVENNLNLETGYVHSQPWPLCI